MTFFFENEKKNYIIFFEMCPQLLTTKAAHNSHVLVSFTPIGSSKMLT